jgi:DNA-binding SARP family transcriptional activator
MTSPVTNAEHALRVHLLGVTRVGCGATRIDMRLSTSSLLILAMLLQRSDEPVRRDELAFRLWPDREEKHALANVRRNLYRLQAELPPPLRGRISSTARHLMWVTGTDDWIDVREFERWSARPDGLEAALHLYTGEFMPRIDHEWCNGERSRLAAAYRRILEDVIRRRKAAGDFIATLRYAEALLEADPWREDVLCTFMELRWRLGDRAGALAAYRDFCGRIKAELGVDPLPETKRFKEWLASARRGDDGDPLSAGSEAGARISA